MPTNAYLDILENLKKLREACFSYFKLGGRAVDGPVELLSM